jgi:aerobic carbon-monoxide dehydrogenase small subunit
VTTIEGLAPVAMLHPVQQAFWNEHGLQCGFCTPGMVLSTVALLADDPDPSEESIRHGLEGNICRCTGYHNIVRSVQTAAKSLAAGATPEPLLSRDPAQAR